MGELPKLESLIGKEISVVMRDCSWVPETRPIYKVLGIDRDMLLIQDLSVDGQDLGPKDTLFDCLWLHLSDIRSIECAAPKA